MDKNIHRTDKSGKFTVIDNRLIRDRRLSLSAKGLASVLLERPDDWKIYARDIVKRSSDGRVTLGNTLDELEELGYLSRRRKRGSHGRFNGWDVQFYESPELNPIFNRSLTINRNTEIGEPGIGDTKFGETEIGATEIGISAPTKDGSEPIPDLNQKRKEKKTDGTVGNAREQREDHQPTVKTAAAAEITGILDLVSAEMAKPLQAPESLLTDLHKRGETAESTKRAWEACKTNARKPSGAFVCWLKSGYLPQQTSNFQARIGKNPPPSSATPPPASSSTNGSSLQETPEERKARVAAELAAMQAKTAAEAGSGVARLEQEVASSQEATSEQEEESESALRARKKAELAEMLIKSRGGSR